MWSSTFAVTAKRKIVPVIGSGSRRRLRDLDGTFIFFLSHFSQQGRPHGLILHQEYADEFLEAVDLCLPIFDGRLVPAGREISMIRFGIHKVLPTVLDIIRARNHSVHGRREFVVSTSPRCLRVALQEPSHGSLRMSAALCLELCWNETSCSRPDYSSVAERDPPLLEHRSRIDGCGPIGEAERLLFRYSVIWESTFLLLVERLLGFLRNARIVTVIDIVGGRRTKACDLNNNGFVPCFSKMVLTRRFCVIASRRKRFKF